MPGQIFRILVEKEYFFDFLEENCVKYDTYYLINKIAFKKSIFNNSLEHFCIDIKNNYYKSKQYYATRKLTYSKFTTIIRQICKSLDIKYESKIKYDKSVYDIVYKIYFTEENQNSDDNDNDNNNDNDNDD